MALQLALACVAMSLLMPYEAPAAPRGRAAEQAMMDAVNEARKDHGRRALSDSPPLARSAGRVAARLMKLDVFGHLGGPPAGWAVRGEALALHRGWRARPRATVRRWLRSPSHRVVVLGNFRAGGAGIKRGLIGDRLTTVLVLHVGSR
jgi:uncharacterized protein YkwD